MASPESLGACVVNIYVGSLIVYGTGCICVISSSDLVVVVVGCMALVPVCVIVSVELSWVGLFCATTGYTLLPIFSSLYGNNVELLPTMTVLVSDTSNKELFVMSITALLC